MVPRDKMEHAGSKEGQSTSHDLSGLVCLGQTNSFRWGVHGKSFVG